MESGWSACSSHHQKLGGCQNLLETAKVTEELLIRRLDSEFGEHISGELIEKRLSSINMLNDHLEKISQNSSLLVARLQRQYTGEHIIVDAKFQRDFESLCRSMCSEIRNLPQTSDNVKETTQISQRQSQLETLTRTSESLLACFEQYSEALNSARRIVDDLGKYIG
eukprot:470706_1